MKAFGLILKQEGVRIAVKFSQLSESQRSDVLAFIQKLLDEHEKGEEC